MYLALLGKPENILIIKMNIEDELILNNFFNILLLDLAIISIIPRSISILENTNIGNSAGNKLFFQILKDVETLSIIELELVKISNIKTKIIMIYK